MGQLVQRAISARTAYARWARPILAGSYRQLAPAESAHRDRSLAKIRDLDARCLRTSKALMIAASEFVGPETATSIRGLATARISRRGSPEALRAEMAKQAEQRRQRVRRQQDIKRITYRA